VATVTILVARLTTLRVKIKRLYLDRGFYSVPVISWLQALRIPFLMPAIICGKSGGTRALYQGRQSYQTQYTLKSSEYGSVTCDMAVVCRYHKGHRHRHGIQYLVFVVYLVKVPFSQLLVHYRNRFGMETLFSALKTRGFTLES
jgi:putative transposase